MKRTNQLLALIMAAVVLVLAWIALAGEKAADPQAGGTALQITELCAKNDTLIACGSATADYLELYNPGQAIDLSGYTLTCGSQAAQPFVGVTLAAGEYRAFFLTEEATGFTLSASGGEIISLLDANRNTVAQVKTLAMEADQVMLLENGSYRVCADASPGFSNDEAGLAAFRQGIREDDPRLVLSEVLISNQNALPDENGGFCDAVELYNAGSQAISLGDFWLSDDLSSRYAWQLPQRTLQPGEYAVIFCDGQDYFAENGAIHAGFSLNRGETLVLTDLWGRYQALPLGGSLEGQSLALADGAYVSMAPSLGHENTAEGALAMEAERILFDSPLVISEMLFAQSGVPYAGAQTDAVELYNRSGGPVSTAGWYLSDGGDPYAYPLPEMLLQSGEYLVIPCNQGATGFGLREGECLTLTNSLGLCAPPVDWMPSQSGASYYIEYSGQEMSASYGAVSLGFANSAQGAAQYQQSALPQGLHISELLSANSSYIKDSQGKPYDLLELYNASGETLSLTGYALTDNPAKPDKYPLPEISLAAGEYLVLVLSKDQPAGLDYPVIPMTLSSQGGSLYLCQTGRIVDGVIFPQLPPDMAYGRPVGEAGFSCLLRPTLGKANSTGAELSEMPQAVTAQGCYDQVEYLDVVLSGPGPIYYTTNAQAPGENAKLYTGPIRITKTTVIRAQCREPGKQPSQVLDLTYLLNEGDQLSVVTLVADPDALLGGGGIYYCYWTNREIPATVSLFEAEGGGFTVPCGLRMFGGYTRAYDKKSFACMFRDRYGAASLQYPLFGEDYLQEFQAMVLRTGGQDSTKGRIRDELITSLVSQYTDVPVQNYRPVTLYLNGKFWGVYFVREKVNENFVAAHYNARPEEVNLQYGNGTDPEYKALIRYVNTHDMTQQEHYDYVAARIDIDEFIDFHAAQVWTGNVDMGNIKYFKLPGGKWTWVLYDTDLALTVANYDSVAEQFNPAGNGSSDLFSTELICGLLKNHQFREKFLRRLAWQQENIWNVPQLMERIDYLEATVRPDMERDIARWGESQSLWNAKLSYLRYVVENRSQHFYGYIRRYFNLTDSEMLAFGFQKP